MNILIAGEWISDLHEITVLRAFEKLGHNPVRFAWSRHFEYGEGALSLPEMIVKKFQHKYLLGPVFNRVNREFLGMVEDTRPDIVFIYRGTHITAETIKAAKRICPSAAVIGYNNDNPFSKGHTLFLWRHFLRSLPFYDLALAYRHSNLEQFREAGAKRVELLRSWYDPARNHPAKLSEEDEKEFGCDVVFVGHYEPDWRRDLLEAVVESGVSFRLFGPGYDWDPAIRSYKNLSRLSPVRLVWGEEYNKALNGAKIALCFLSKLNQDTYTRRCFEIPASGTMMLSEYTDDLASLYREGEEAEYFRSKEELLEKVRYYISDGAAREAIASAGHARVLADGHDVVSRMRQVVKWADEIRAR